MLRASKKFIQCRTVDEGNQLYWEQALPHIEAIVKGCGVERSSKKKFHYDKNGYYYRNSDRDGVGFGLWTAEDGWKNGLLAFEKYEINESDFIPQGSPEIKHVEAGRFHKQNLASCETETHDDDNRGDQDYRLGEFQNIVVDCFRTTLGSEGDSKSRG